MPTKTPTKTQLEALKIAAEIRHLEAQADAAELKAHALRVEQYDEDASSDTQRVLCFFSDTGALACANTIATLARWSRRDPGEPMTIVLNSPGGSVFHGLALYDSIQSLRASGHDITVTVRGMAASMGGILLQAGDTRIIGKHAHMLIHEVSSVGIGKTSDLEDDLKFTKRLQSRCLDILAERSTMTQRQIGAKWKKTDWWLDAEECVRLGFADEIG